MEIESFFKSRKILVTGHTGFMGSWLTKCLITLDADVCGYALEPPSAPNMYETLGLHQSIKDVRGDIRDRESLQQTIKDFQPEIVIHLAAQPIVLESYNNPVETFDINVTGTVNLLNELKKIQSVESIIVVTSDKSYHNNEWVYPYRETDPLGGKDPYSASKSCQEIAVNSFRESFFSDSGIGISSIRAGNVIGGGDWAEHRIIPDLVRGITRGETVKIRNPNAVRPWQHVMEPISGMLTLAEKMQKDLKFSGAWNFGPNDEKGVTVKELVEKFIKYWGEGNYEIQKKRFAKESNYLMLDISKANKILKWFPVFDLDTALKMTTEWYRTYYSNASSINVVLERQISSFLRIV